MQERFETLILAGVLALVACGGIEDGSALVRSTEALSCQTDTDCHDGYACAHFSTRSYCEPAGRVSATAGGSPASARGACRTDGDCGTGEECEAEHGQSYCVSHGEEDKPEPQADAGARSDAGEEHCRHGGEDCDTERCADAGEDRDCREDDDGDDDEDRSGPNRGRH